jgi:hypothetical protein
VLLRSKIGERGLAYASVILDNSGTNGTLPHFWVRKTRLSPVLAPGVRLSGMNAHNMRKQARAAHSPRRSFLADLWPTALAILGTLILCYATILQLTKAPETAETKSRLQRSQLVIDIAEGQRDQWLIALNQELTRDKPNRSMLAAAALESITTNARWRSYLAMRTAKSQDEANAAISERDAIIAQAEELNKRGDVDGLIGMTRAFAIVMKSRNELRQSDNLFFAEVDEANAMDTKISTRIAASYVIGSTIMLISTVVSTLQSNRTLNKIEDRLA